MSRRLRKSGADTVIAGAYHRRGDTVILRGWVFDLARGKTRADLAVIRAPFTDASAAVEAMAERLPGSASPQSVGRRGGSAVAVRKTFSVPRPWDVRSIGRWLTGQSRKSKRRPATAQFRTRSRGSRHSVRPPCGGQGATTSRRRSRGHAGVNRRAVAWASDAVEPGAVGWGACGGAGRPPGGAGGGPAAVLLAVAWRFRELVPDLPGPRGLRVLNRLRRGNDVAANRRLDAASGLRGYAGTLFAGARLQERLPGRSGTPAFTTLTQKAEAWFAAHPPPEAASEVQRSDRPRLRCLAVRDAEARAEGETPVRESPRQPRLSWLRRLPRSAGTPNARRPISIPSPISCSTRLGSRGRTIPNSRPSSHRKGRAAE